MSNIQSDPLLQVETTCGTLLHELQIIWDEVGESDGKRDKMLLELEQECLQAYRRKVDQANKCRAQLRQAIADSEAELAGICSAMGERPVHIRQSDQTPGSLKAELRVIIPQLEEMRKRKCDRRNQFIEVLEQMHTIRNDICRSTKNIAVDETDLSLIKLEELQRELQAYQKEKSDRLDKVLDCLNTLNSLCLVLSVDFKQTVNEIHPSLSESDGAKNVSNNTIEKLGTAIKNFRDVKMRRMQQLQDLATSMLELWNLMDTPIEEQQTFQNVTSTVAAEEHEITEPNMLSVDFINYVQAEVSRLEELKATKMKELVLKKRSELEEICRKTHMIPESESATEIVIEAIESGDVDPSSVLQQIELRIAKAKEEAFSKKEILDRVEKWMAACGEECWLEEYNMDENRYNAGRGAHLTLKRAEKARVLMNKLPAMVEALAMKTTAWENERGIEFTYDGIRLLSMLEEYTVLQQEKEQERKRQKEQKKIQGQLITEQEALFGSKPSPMKNQNTKKGPRLSCGGGTNRRLSLGGAMLQTPKHDLLHFTKETCNRHQTKKNDHLRRNDQLNHPRDDGYATLSAGRRGLDVVGLPTIKHSFNATTAHEPESPMIRKPFSLISSAESTKSNATNILKDMSQKENDMLPKPLSSPNKRSMTTPSKTLALIDEGNKTPNTMTIPVPSTPSIVSVTMQTAMTPAPDNRSPNSMTIPVPSTVSVPMQTAMTPAPDNRTPNTMTIPVPTTPSTVSVPMQTTMTPAPDNRIVNVGKEIEYSFEERRAGFVLPIAKAHPRIQIEV